MQPYINSQNAKAKLVAYQKASRFDLFAFYRRCIGAFLYLPVINHTTTIIFGEIMSFKRIVRHIIFWLANIALYSSTTILAGGFNTAAFLSGIIHFIILAAVVYTNLNWLLPRYLQTEKYFRYFSLIVATITIGTIALGYAEHYYLNKHLHTNPPITLFDAMYGNAIACSGFVVVTSTIKFTLEAFRQRKRAAELEVTNLKNELLYLKAQMNPHFLFNSINAIYASIDKQNEAARQMLLKFSDILRYQLYECDDDYVLYSNEVKYLKSYIELQKTRKNDNVAITYTFNTVAADCKIPPLLFIPFVENAFKYVTTDDNRQNYIYIEMSATAQNLQFTCINSKENNAPATAKQGIGIANVKRRLALLFDKNYELTIKDTVDTFSVYLNIDYAKLAMPGS